MTCEWRVLMFAHLKDRHGPVVLVRAEPKVDAVLDALRENGVDVRSSRLAVNDEFGALGQELSAGDELALIPPVSGG